jgi:signal transduction histidine kinase
MITGTQKREKEERRQPRSAPRPFAPVVCLLDETGRALWTNRTGARGGSSLHKVVHRECGDPGCYLAGYWEQLHAQLVRQPRVEYVTWDQVFERHIKVRAEVLASGGEQPAAPGACFAVIVEDAGEPGAQEEWLTPDQALRVARTQMWRLAAQHLHVQEAERRRIAGELHDGLGQTLSLVKQSIDEAARLANSASAKLEGSLQRLSSLVSTALTDMHRIAMNLQPSLLEDLGILATLSWYFREMESSYREVSFVRQIGVEERDVPELLRLPIFRIVQEATANALKHARAGRIKVALAAGAGTVKLSVEDNGRGFEVDNVQDKRDFTHGLGLQSMKERAELSGGSYQFQSAPGKGTRISVIWRKRQMTADGDCPVIPAPRNVAQAMCGSSLDEVYLSKSLPVCLACLRALPPDAPEGRTRN